MNKPKSHLGTVDSISAFTSGEGETIIYINSRAFVAVIDRERFPIIAGSIVEYRTQGNRCEILGVQADLISVPRAADLFGGGQ